MIDDRIPVTIVAGGYNYSWVDALVTETYPRWKSNYLRFTTEETDVRMYFDYPYWPKDPLLKSAKCSVAVSEEPYFAVPEFSILIRDHTYYFDAAFSNKPGHLDIGNPKIRYYPGSFSNIAPKDWRLYPKTRMICAIFSRKSFAEGHKLRQQIINTPFFRLHPIMVFVNSVPYVEVSYMDKVNLISPYRFNVGIENEFGTLFTEKLLDSLLTGTIPIYKGNKRINEYFNMDGIIEFDTIEELMNIVNRIGVNGEKYYLDRLPAIQDNLERAKRFANVGDVLWTHGLQEVFKEKGII